MPDGTVILTAPTGHTYTTEAHSAGMFPTLAQPTSELPVPTLDEPSRCRDAMMPRRKQTRDQDRATASTPNAASAPNSSPTKNANAKPGSPPTTNHHPSEGVALAPVGLSA
jgi:hypothetical protein